MILKIFFFLFLLKLTGSFALCAPIVRSLHMMQAVWNELIPSCCTADSTVCIRSNEIMPDLVACCPFCFLSVFVVMKNILRILRVALLLAWLCMPITADELLGVFLLLFASSSLLFFSCVLTLFIFSVISGHMSVTFLSQYLCGCDFSFNNHVSFVLSHTHVIQI